MEHAVVWETIQPGVVLVTMEHPPANALAPALLDGLHAAMDAANESGNVRVMILRSALRGFFAAGADIKHLSSIDAESFTAYGDKMRAVNDRLTSSPWISVAAVNGPALGGGLELAMACTLRVSGPDGTFGLPEVNIGLIPGAGGTQRLPRLVGRGHALDIMLTARQVPAAEAYAMGLVDRVVEGDVVEAASDLARTLTRGSLPAQLAVVATVDAAFDMTLPDGAAFEIAEEQNLFENGEAVEGITAFVEKRRPQFR